MEPLTMQAEDDFLKDVVPVTNKQERSNWPDEVRLEMIERSEFYDNPTVYQYGYYDGYQKAMRELQTENNFTNTYK